MTASGCKQTTVADVISGWQFSGPLADQIRRRKLAAASQEEWAQSNILARFGIEGKPWVRLRWASNWQKRRTHGWSGRAVTQWLWRKVQDQNPKPLLNANGPDWYTAHQP